MPAKDDDSFPMSSDFIYECALFFWKMVVSIFFREIRPRGAYNIPREGPVILVVAPHHNQFLDPLQVAIQVHRETRRRTRFLIAAVSMKRKAVGFFASLMSSIPVSRAADDATPGRGQIYLDDNDPCLVLGEDTRFTEEFTPKMQILLSKSAGSVAAEVVEVISDTQLRIKREFGGESGKGTSRVREKVAEAREAGKKGIEYKKLPFVDQSSMYRHVYKCLKDGGCIGIFPEGGSHDRTDLLPLKAGVSLMALGAMANDPNCKVKIVPVGLTYFHAEKFRSRLVVEFGKAMDVPEQLVSMFKAGGEQKRDAVAKLLDTIYNGLKTVTIRAPDYDTLMVIQATRRLYGTPGQHLTLSQVVELNKRFLEGYNHFKDEPRILALREKVLKYNRLLRDLGLRDHQVPRAQKASWHTLGLLIYRLILLSIWTVFALPGSIINAPIFLAAKIMSAKKAKEALAKSTVKIQARDVVATWKVLISLGLAPIVYAIYAIIVTVIAAKAGAPLVWRILTPIILICSLPFIGYAALKFGEAGMDVLKSLRPLIVALVPGQQKSLNQLKAMRVELTNELADIINTFGPQYYEDFDEWRILVPSSRPPPSNGNPTLRLRHGGPKSAEAQTSLLVHPMTWLDERLFGWSTSSRRGTSAWLGSPSADTTRHGTPDHSDSEDSGDYEHVLGVLSPGTMSPQHSRSRAGSYADLQRLRLSKPGTHQAATLVIPVAPSHSGSTTTNSPQTIGSGVDGSMPSSPESPKTRHPRRMSLSDGVHVGRIAAVPRRESFDSATKEINREIEERGPH